MAAIGSDRAGNRRISLIRGIVVLWRGLQAAVAVALLAGAVALPAWFLRDTFSRDIGEVPVVVALTGGKPAPGQGARQATAPAAGVAPALPSPMDAVATIEAGSAPEAPVSGAVSRSPRPQPRPAATRDGDDWTALPGAIARGRAA